MVGGGKHYIKLGLNGKGGVVIFDTPEAKDGRIIEKISRIVRSMKWNGETSRRERDFEI